MKDDGTGAWFSMKNVYAVCVDYTETDKCTPEDKSSFLLAYSNDLSIGEFNGLVNYLKVNFPKEKISPQFNTFLQVRFDANNNDGVSSSTDIDEWFSTLEKNPPNPSDALDPSEETDIIDVLKNHTATCGSKIVVLMKRPLLETNYYTMTVENLQKLRTTLYTISPVLENREHLGITKMSALTDGYGIFSNAPYPDALANIPLLGTSYCLYSFNIRITGNREPFKLYDLKINTTGVYTLMIISDIKLEGTNYFELEYTDYDNSQNKGTLNSSIIDAYQNMIWKELTFEAGVYLLMLKNDLPGYQDFYAANTRVYSKEPVDYWVP
ncbi:hypothetical protein CAEBREN_05058 [Caenorhabditis brenneri]|uniref:Uncharacterized protein n=1 Tax=Caenorhabditis brenneri TaxID=135651 RepID=G0N2M6_CAEBE|nr:hypothetical protein CAEBREN_05058 [Caenorhabditis brenneri]